MPFWEIYLGRLWLLWIFELTVIAATGNRKTSLERLMETRAVPELLKVGFGNKNIEMELWCPYQPSTVGVAGGKDHPTPLSDIPALLPFAEQLPVKKATTNVLSAMIIWCRLAT